MEYKYEVDCAYPNGGRGIGIDPNMDSEIRAAGLYKDHSAGSGFGMRDMQFGMFDTKKEARDIAAAIIKVFRKHGLKDINKGPNDAYVNVCEVCKDCGCQHDGNETCPDWDE